jgi:hypothetical protein
VSAVFSHAASKTVIRLLSRRHMRQRISLSERKVNAPARRLRASLRPIRRRLARRFPGQLNDRARTTIRTVELGDCVVAPRQPESLPVTRGASRGGHKIGIAHHRTIDPTIRPSVATEPKWLSNTASSDRAHYGEGRTRVLCQCRMRHVPPSSTNTIARRFTTAFTSWLHEARQGRVWPRTPPAPWRVHRRRSGNRS